MENSVDETIKTEFGEVEKKYHQKLINCLIQRGWGLYLAGPAGTLVTLEQEIESFVSGGPEKEMLQEGFSYQLLPYIEENSNWEKVKEAMNQCIATYRYPFWADLVSGIEKDENGNEKDYIKVIGVYLIDAIIYEKPNYELVIDYLLMGNLNIVTENKGNIILNVNDVDKVLKQLTKQIR